MRLTGWHRVGLVLLSDVLHALAFPPVGWWPLAWVALVPLLVALRGARPGAAAGLGMLWGIGAIWGVGHWLPVALAHYYQQPLWFGVLFAFGASIVFIGIYHTGFALTAALLAPRRAGPAYAVAVAGIWVAWELAKARVLTGDPWLLVGYALMDAPALIQIADLGGVYLLSFVVVLVNAALATALATAPRRRRLAALTLAATTLGATLAYGGWRMGAPPHSEARWPVTVVQGNNDVGAEWRREFYGEGLDRYLRLSYDAAVTHADAPLVIWPESAVTFFLAEERLHREQIGRMLTAAGGTLVVGGPFREVQPSGQTRYFNSAFFVDAGGAVRDRYDKTHLLPFAEYFPLRTVEFLRRRFERVRYFTAGRGAAPLETARGAVATVICFEGMFPELVREQMRQGAGLLINLSNDAWLAGAGPEQHLQMVALRAVEFRTWVIRATTTGISAIIDPLGRTVARGEIDTAAALNGEVGWQRVATPYQRWGDVFAWTCVLVTAVSGGVRWRRRGRELLEG